MSHRCGSGCYRKQGIRNECPTCNRAKERAAETRRLRRVFEQLPKGRHWQARAYRHLGQHGLTPTIVAETLEAPTVLHLQNRGNRAFYKYYPKGSRETASLSDAQEGGWFRAVLDAKGVLVTAFRDNETEMKGGHPSCPTPNTRLNRLWSGS